MDLSEFLTARLDEDEAVWQAAATVATDHAERFCCAGALSQIAARRVLARGGLGIASMAADYDNHPDYQEGWRP